MTLVAFDFDGTLSDSEMTVLLGERAGVASEIDAITERAMNDEIGYAESLRERGVTAALEREGVGVDRIVANRLPMEDGALSGDVEGPLIEGTKDDALEDLLAEEGLDLADAIAVGDGANDLPMLEVAGLAVGFDPKPAVEPACDVTVETMAELREVLENEGVL